MLLMWIHPILQALCLCLAVYVLHMGLQRFRFQHLKQKAMFNWKRHVLLGQIVNWTWLLGMGLGLFMAHNDWGNINLTGGHFLVGTLMVPLIVASLATGYMLKTPKGKRPKLALTHGGLNTLLFFCALYQGVTGLEVIRLFLLE